LLSVFFIGSSRTATEEGSELAAGRTLPRNSAAANATPPQS
jgi:hypothetical protein